MFLWTLPGLLSDMLITFFAYPLYINLNIALSDRNYWLVFMELFNMKTYTQDQFWPALQINGLDYQSNH